MSDALLTTLSKIFILIIIGFFGWLAAHTGRMDDKGRSVTAKLVQLALPFMLFYSVTSKFSHDQLIELLKMAWLPFIMVTLNSTAALLFVKAGLVREEIRGVFYATSTGSTVLYVGIPLIAALFGESGVPYLLVYFFANVTFIWTAGLYMIQVDGVHRNGGMKPKLISPQSLKMLLSPPLMGFFVGVCVVILNIPVPAFVSGTAHSVGSVASPLALFFIGMTIWKVGFDKLRHLPAEVWLVVLFCFVIRPLFMYALCLPFDMDPVMRKVFVASAALPVTSAIAVIAKTYGADEAFASEAIGATTICLVFYLPVMLFIVEFV